MQIVIRWLQIVPQSLKIVANSSTSFRFVRKSYIVAKSFLNRCEILKKWKRTTNEVLKLKFALQSDVGRTPSEFLIKKYVNAHVWGWILNLFLRDQPCYVGRCWFVGWARARVLFSGQGSGNVAGQLWHWLKQNPLSSGLPHALWPPC